MERFAALLGLPRAGPQVKNDLIFKASPASTDGHVHENGRSYIAEAPPDLSERLNKVQTHPQPTPTLSPRPPSAHTQPPRRALTPSPPPRSRPRPPLRSRPRTPRALALAPPALSPSHPPHGAALSRARSPGALPQEPGAGAVVARQEADDEGGGVPVASDGPQAGRLLRPAPSGLWLRVLLTAARLVARGREIYVPHHLTRAWALWWAPGGGGGGYRSSLTPDRGVFAMRCRDSSSICFTIYTC